MIINRLKNLILSTLLSCCLTPVQALEEDVIEHLGNKYVIHVDQLKPDTEMTLLDVLHICPELMSYDGRSLTADYLLSVDDIMLSVDYEPLLESIKACELSEVVVCTYGAVNNATDGVQGSIDLAFKEGEGLTGKIGVNGSTYGNGKLYADIASRGENVTVRSFVQANLHYGKTTTETADRVSMRRGTENAMVFVDWQMTNRDLVKLKLSQGYDDWKRRVAGGEGAGDMQSRQRWGELVATYERTLNDNDAGLYIETGLNYTSDNFVSSLRTTYPWWIVEFGIPLSPSLSMTTGWEGGYQNCWYPENNREQYLNNDLYLMLDYTKGPWVVSIGDRFRINNFWNKEYTAPPSSLWSYHRNDHALHASVGYKKGRHFVQGTFSRTYFNPVVALFYDIDADNRLRYNTSVETNLAWRSELRYTYQRPGLVATGGLMHTLLTDQPTTNESLTELRTSVTWYKGPVRLTAGANLYHQHINSGAIFPDGHNNDFVVLKLSPTLLLGKGFRLSSTLIYNSRQESYLKQYAHLYASVKLNKDLGRRCNVYADFHDIAGQPKADLANVMQSYYNRALTIGLTYYPFR